MNSVIHPNYRGDAERAQHFLHERFKMGKPEVIQADAAGAFFMFGDSPQTYKLPFTMIGNHH